MFTGIIEDLVSVSNIKKDGGFTIFDVKSKLVNEMNLGDSIALNGVCLTVVYLDINVFTVNVSVGQKVKEGDTVLVLEAMKMETNIRAGDSGTVSEIKVESGDAVKVGDVLLTLT